MRSFSSVRVVHDGLVMGNAPGSRKVWLVSMTDISMRNFRYAGYTPIMHLSAAESITGAKIYKEL